MTTTRFTLSFSHSDDTQDFGCASAAGLAFAGADATLGPRVIVAEGRGARTIARCVRIGDAFAKSAPQVDSFPAESGCDRAFWTAYHGAATPLTA